MSASDTSTISHLQSSAHSLVRSSPAIASHLYGKFLETASTKYIKLPTQLARSACAACNTVWIPGYNLQVYLHSFRAKTPASPAKRKDKRQREADKIVKEHLDHRIISVDSKKIEINNLPPENDKVMDGKDKRGKFTVLCYICLTCTHITRFSIPDINSSLQGKNIVSRVMETPTSTPQKAGGSEGQRTPVQDTPSSAKLSTSASSRKRQKMRKQNSLQQMLAKVKAEKSERQGNGLNLMDIMKSSSNQDS
ncbi:hypothetical protein POJ06DRAFT_96441 [Lipomyces tetrasporus]|uniref:Uncharacterized protein n=1 Tax=Lipomyces tetrasporus TaxID=54092 RepID=A0AAD7QTW3_9ASCO|nr:uncharacterized protein POJ06DRAFT_96441 [Lipomyces tetrasporus]KAJ8101412.1 hypothetical protein POJ06DRAFT_96441 [Lipomyces tetrasporus]